MGNIANITYQGGTHGRFLSFFLDKFSRRTPEITHLPFTKAGTSHAKKEMLSGKFPDWHNLQNGKDIFMNTHERHVLITVETEDLLNIERAVTMRTGDLNVDTNKENVETTADFLQVFPWADKCAEMYNLDLTTQNIPRFIMRDFYKKSFLDPEQNGFIVADRAMRNNKPAECFEFPVSHMWNKDKFIETIKALDKKFDLQLDIPDFTIYDTFRSKYPPLATEHRTSNAIDHIKNKQDMDISELETVEQAYLASWIEKNYDFITVPLTNYFFQSTKEICQWLECYPQEYKAMNPNLPTFNGIPNPYHLAKLKK